MASATEKLIEAVKANIVLYDMSDPEYKNIRRKDVVWNEIGKMLGIDGEILKKQWKNLKDSYSKYLRSEKPHTGQQTKCINRYKTWPWAQQMHFLRPFVQFARTESNVSDINTMMDERDDCEENRNLNMPSCLTRTEDGGLIQEREEHTEGQCAQESVSQAAPTVLTKTRKRSHREDTLPQTSSVDKVLTYLRNRNVNPCSSLDDIDLIFLGYSKTVKKFSPRRQIITKFKIAEIIMNEELPQQMENNNIPTTSLNSDMTSTDTNISVASAQSTECSQHCSASLTSLEPYNAEASCASWYRDFASN